jgi:fatty-acyl-CoA synthase
VSAAVAPYRDEWSGVRLIDLLERAAERAPDAEAYVFEDRRLTVAAALAESRRLARGLLAAGVGRGDRVAVWMPGRAEWVAAYFGLAQIGALMVPLNVRLRASELADVLDAVRPVALLYDVDGEGRRNLDARLEEARELSGGEAAPWSSSLRLQVAVGARPVAGTTSLAALTEAGEALPEAKLAAAVAAVSAEEKALIQYTSGTSARPKGAVLYQEGMVRGGHCVGARIELSGADRFFNPQPFYHVGGSILIMLAPLHFGCPVVTQTYFDPGEALATIERERCTVTIGHQPHWIEYLADPERPRRDLSSLVKAVTLADPGVNRRVTEELGIAVICPYGMSESHLVGTSTGLGDPVEARVGTVGIPHPGVELELQDPETGTAVAAGDAGEVCFRGWCVMRGYADEPGRTAEAIDADGWLHTGDLGRLDDDGRLVLVGRLKEMIRVGGENVAALEVESFLLAAEGVKQAVVVGRRDERLGEVPVAFIELHPGAATDADALVAAARAGLASFKAPRALQIVDSWPLSGTGKIQRGVLRERAENAVREESR